MVSKKNRFEVFKRDYFTCQYCGKTPPEVVLEIDHINPKSNGGKDDINNYLTACFACNRGKGKRLLTSIPESIKSNLDKLKEKRLQLKQYHKYLEKIDKQLIEGIEEVDQVFIECTDGYCLTEGFKNTTVRGFLTKLPTTKVKEAMQLACARMPRNNNRTLKYFCGICWNWIKNPETRGW
jgi:hypothetical protein